MSSLILSPILSEARVTPIGDLLQFAVHVPPPQPEDAALNVTTGPEYEEGPVKGYHEDAQLRSAVSNIE
ncbi:hypothetical protein FIBSPDRAFT_863482 [Athelia psychrophila]|uniref:Uncharacterized protein n=1 Tax=Athelia psychrophila TaxID=1759441 RepID=A0A166HC16_9AGAM|nr:hypothetical protein FIBSPDRAFT_863482 [Fibularhizoctonia sp. CBS 109695]